MKTIRRFQPGDETQLAPLIRRCFFEINIEDYEKEALGYWAELYTPQYVRALSEKADTFVMEEDGTLLGTCSILWCTEADKTGPGADAPENAPSVKGPETGEPDAFIEALYVLPDRAREGIATQLLEVCENDPAFAGAGEIWVHSSITAREFYEQRGYFHETGEPVCIENDRYIMYKPVQKKS